MNQTWGRWRIKTPGIRFEVLVSLAILISAAAGLMGLLVFKFTQKEMITLKVEAGLTLVRAVEEQLNSAETGRRGAAGVIQSFAENGFDQVVVVDRTGAVREEYDSGVPGYRPDRALFTAALSTGELQINLNRSPSFLIFSEPTLTMVAPLYKGPLVTGAVGLYSSLARLRASWERIKMIIWLYLFFDAVIAVLFGAWLLTKRVIDPLARLSGKVKELEEGRYEPGRAALAATDNEVGRLEASFERMAAGLLQGRDELKEKMASLERAQRDLIRSEKLASVGRLAAGLAHELGNPLGAVLGFVHLLRRDDLHSEEKDDFLNRMESELTRMDGIIRSLLDFARRRPEETGPVDLNQAASHALTLASVQKWFMGLEVKTYFAENLPPVGGEQGRLTQVLLNLLTNAGQAMKGRGELTITTGRASGEVVLTVADTGPGIPPDVLNHIFEPFFTTKEPGQGTGLGLSVSLAIVEQFGGRIEAAARPGRGAVFSVILPEYEERPSHDS
ncbi:MAG: ATP-binding protein [Pseudomonadota bacterium]